MDSILQSGIEQILWLQAHSTPGLDAFFHQFTNFGGRYYLFMLPILIWCIDFRTGSRVLLWMAFTLFVNSLLKDAIGQPRPFQMDAQIISDGEEGYGLPSGHAQLVVIYWGLTAAWLERRWFWALSIAIMLTMAFSRVYLGVHFPTDVYAGLILGGATLWVALRYGAAIETRLAANTTAIQMAVLAGTSLLVLAVNGSSFESGLMIGCAGFVMGTGGGLILVRDGVPFTGHGRAWKRVLCFFVGVVALLVLIRVGTALVESSGPGLGGDVMLYFTLLAMGAWFTAGAPMLFGLMRLGDKEPDASPG
jgi:membrane-associated phospholipid phosphatase